MTPSPVIVHISGPKHSKKTTIAVAIYKILHDLGVDVKLPPDDELGDKLDMSMDELREKLKEFNSEVLIMESYI